MVISHFINRNYKQAFYQFSTGSLLIDKINVKVFAPNFEVFFNYLFESACSGSLIDFQLQFFASKVIVKKADDSIEVVKNRYGANIASQSDYQYFDSSYELKQMIAGTCFEPRMYDKAMFFNAFLEKNYYAFSQQLNLANFTNQYVSF